MTLCFGNVPSTLFPLFTHLPQKSSSKNGVPGENKNLPSLDGSLPSPGSLELRRPEIPVPGPLSQPLQ